MTLEELKKLRDKIKTESSAKQDMRRKNNHCFIPSEYFKYGITARDIFKREVERKMKGKIR